MMETNFVSLAFLSIFIFATLTWLFLTTLKEGNKSLKEIREKNQQEIKKKH